jgi:hypothetical protein
MHDKLFSKPQILGAKDFTGYAEAIGLDEGAFKECID